MTQEMFGKIITLIEQSRSFRFTPEEQQTWWMLLSPLDDGLTIQATVDVLRTIEGRIMPAHIWNRTKAIERDRPVPRLPMLDESSPSEESVRRGLEHVRQALDRMPKGRVQ